MSRSRSHSRSRSPRRARRSRSRRFGGGGGGSKGSSSGAPPTEEALLDRSATLVDAVSDGEFLELSVRSLPAEDEEALLCRTLGANSLAVQEVK